MTGGPRLLYVDAEPADLDRAAGSMGADGASAAEGTTADGSSAAEADSSALTATTAAEAIECVRTRSVDCVVFGGDLPDADGIEFVERLREVDPSVPCVLFVETEYDPTAAAAIEAGGTGYLHRVPGTDQRAELAEAVDRVLARHRERTLGDSQERFRTLVEGSSDVVAILDQDAVFRYQSPSVEGVLGYAPADLVGEHALEYVHPEDRDRVAREFHATVEDPDRSPTVEYRFRHADGSWQTVESRATNMFDDPVVEGLVVNTREVTDRRRRDQRMNVLNRTLRHDLRNAMNVVLGNAELLMREYGTDDRAETIRRTAADMLDLGNKVRDIERALDTAESAREMVDIVGVTEEALAAVERSEPDLTVERELPDSEWVLANRQIGSAVEDAVENAVEHNDSPDPVLRVTVEDDALGGEDAVTLTVADDGPGIPEEELEILRGGETPLEHTSGIGLWLIEWIVAESAGEVTFAESELGGTAVRITLRTADASEAMDPF